MRRMMRTSAGLFPAFSLFAAHALLGPTTVDSAPAPAPAPAPPALELNISAAGPGVALSYTLSVDGVLWLQGSPLKTIHVQGKETALTYTSTAEGTGDDAIGMYHSTAITWDAAGTVVVTEFREYREATPAAVVFSLQFPQGAADTARPNHDSTPLAGFPAFASDGGLLGSLGYRSWSGAMCSDDASTIPLNYSQIMRDPNQLAAINSIANGPIALYKEHDGATLFVAPHSEFMTEQHRALPGPTGSLMFGPGGELTSLPAGFKQETIIVVGGDGITPTVLGWGKHAKAAHSPPDTPKLPDVTLSELGYWTDNGAYYYFYAKPTTRPYEPEVVLRQVVAAYRELEVPIKYIQLDAWWYRTHECEQGYACACIEDFAPDTSAFRWNGTAPSGPGPYFNSTLAHLAAELDVQWDLYQNYFCPTRNGKSNAWAGKGYQFIETGPHDGTGFAHVVPEQSRKFFADVWGKGVAQGMAAAEWDYQSTAYSMMPHYRSNATAASMYMAGMADAALGLGIPLQWCMSYPRYILESLKHPAVTNARGSEDYAAGYTNLMGVGYTSLLYEAVGIRASKDNFATNDRTQVIVSLLTMGPVGPSNSLDTLGDRSAWLKATCNAEGVLLQPSTPLRTIDARFALPGVQHAVPISSEVWAASSTVVGAGINYTTHIVLALTLPKDGFPLWRNDTWPRMVNSGAAAAASESAGTDEPVDFVFRVHPAGYHPPPTGGGNGSSSGAGAGVCTNGTTINMALLPTAAQRGNAARAAAAAKCVVQPGRDIASGEAATATPGHPNTIGNATHESCCAACASSPSCTSWIYGPLNGANYCFLAQNVRGTIAAADRDFCCMEAPPGYAGISTFEGNTDLQAAAAAAASSCAAPVPAAGVPLTVESPGEVNCSAASPNDPTNGHDELVTVYPIVYGFVLLGELDKWVTASPNRFSNLSITPNALSVDLRGGVGEVCTVTVLVEGVVAVKQVRIGVGNTASLVFRKE